MDVAQRYHQDALVQLRKYKELAERAVAQLPPAACFTALDAESYSIALIMKHMAGNMRSRWTDFLSTDGEKPRRGSSPHDIHHVLGRAALYRKRAGYSAAQPRGVWRSAHRSRGAPALDPLPVESAKAPTDPPRKGVPVQPLRCRVRPEVPARFHENGITPVPVLYRLA